MNVRLKKEFQGLFWPWLMATAIGLLPVLSSLLISHGVMTSDRTVYSIASSTYVLGVVMLAAMLFGTEFQERTFSLLFSQPCRRATIWWEKIFVTCVAIGLLTLFHLAGGSSNIGALHSYYKHLFGLLPFLFCAAMFWSLVTRSVLGGVVLSIFSLAALYLIAWLILDEFLYLYRLSPDLTKINVLLTRISLIAAPFFLWLSWLRFRRLDITSNWESATEIIPLAGGDRKSIIDFRSRADRPLFNLIVKELRLLRPVFLMMLLFTILWVTAVIGSVFRPDDTAMLTKFMDGVSSIYAPFVILLAGCVSLGEEKRLGIHAGNLSSPISTRIQFLVKNLLAVLTGLSGTVLLFALLSFLTSKKLDLTPVKILGEPAHFIVFACVFLAVLVQISFWAATVADRTAHAVFLAVTVAIGFYAVFSFAMVTGASMKNLVQGPIYWLIAHFQLSHVFIAEWLGFFAICGLTLSAATVIVPAWTCFRRLNSEQQNLKTALLLPLLALFLTGTLSGALEDSLSWNSFSSSPIYRETESALISLKAHIDNSNEPSSSRWIASAELIATGKLSPATQAWLRNSSIKINYSNHSLEPDSMALIFFPKGTMEQPIPLSFKAAAKITSWEEAIRKNHGKNSKGQP